MGGHMCVCGHTYSRGLATSWASVWSRPETGLLMGSYSNGLSTRLGPGATLIISFIPCGKVL